MIEMSKRVFIIAEAGVNHNGDINTAKKLIDIACDAGADAVKFQTFKAENLVTKNAVKAEYQKEIIGSDVSQLEMLKKLEISQSFHKELTEYSKSKGIIFLSSSFDLESMDLLIGLGLDIFKIPSGEITNLPYLRKVGSLGKQIIMSTGMANLDEIKTALDILISSGTNKANIIILHCNSEYPTPFEDANILAMSTIRDKFDVKVGYSDHTLGIEASIAAVALGAIVIEKHFTLDKGMSGPDHKASLDPKELESMVKAIRNIEKGLGNGIKKVTPSEAKNKSIVRKSIVASKDIKKGDIFSKNNIAAKRPGMGISPMEWSKVIGKTAKKPFRVDEPIEL